MTDGPSHTTSSPQVVPGRVDPHELRRRAGLVRQTFRFIVLNAKILRLTRQHH